MGSTWRGVTTITNLINRFYDIQSGAITVDGVDIRQISRENLRKNIAMVLQDTHSALRRHRDGEYPLRQAGRHGRGGEAQLRKQPPLIPLSAVCRMGTTPCWRATGPICWTAAAQQHCKGGHLQGADPDFDEATSSVDTCTEKHIEHGMDRLMADRTTCVIAHRLSTVRTPTLRIMQLSTARSLSAGDHDELLKLKGRYYELYTGLKELD